MDYGKIFRHRGKSYDLAMKKYPNVRDEEFNNLFFNKNLTKNELILDVPALGGYLQKYCRKDNKVIFLDFAQSINGIEVVSPYNTWNIPAVDRAVCLAAIHHIDNFNLFIKNLSLHIKKNGFIHIADVAKTNKISKFLDEFVGSNTSTGGHKGKYYDWETISFPKNLKIIEIKERSCPWTFGSEEEMIEYCKLLFDLKNVKDNEVLYALKTYIGYKKQKKVKLYWRLTYIDLQKI